MTIHTRITFWLGAVLLVSLVVMALAFRYEWREDRQARLSGQTPLDSDWEETGEFVLQFGLPTALVLLVGGSWLLRRALAPIARLSEAAERLHLHHLQERLPPVGTGDELDRLTEVFNAMTARLQQSFGRVREFTLHASHELKTPLTIMQGELETALRDEHCADAQREMLASLLDEVHRLAKIADGLTLLAKADAGQVTLKRESVRFDELVQDSYNDAQMLARSQGIIVTLAAFEETTIQGDRYRLRQLLLNLTENAIKYNQPQGRVGMTLRRSGDAVELMIANTGPGISPEILPRVFDPFFRGDPAHGSEVEGCGLGLAIAQWIVQAHGGTIHIDSHLNAATTVTVCLPQPG